MEFNFDVLRGPLPPLRPCSPTGVSPVDRRKKFIDLSAVNPAKKWPPFATSRVTHDSLFPPRPSRTTHYAQIAILPAVG